ncbi:MAG: XRE family transcriptional regulator [Spirochaetaceae bacterium]|jgi:HTH-type transcriptional regulator/antitoxin HipB|nr:XRE family transcriptional regulator [Spirochaetaceae bacterium]
MEIPILTPFQLGQRLKARRKQLKVTQIEAGSKVGLLPKTISTLELTPEKCTISSLLKLLSALDLEIIFLPKNSESEKTKNQDW